ncbi:TOX high mobility group box family member 2-like isoform X2 [Salvelinus fontinalis]|uniref:TOX high mobility group box family member 2-like isoform X3 n=1 Tax=Salvelinus namaycush TaxID=8040 RepID=A0A8U1F7A7_SALNM|nr:TOX high mobility group box family member 2-like isoform X3 [Salvelinus namaycush]XP_055764996.1 TOX high mobility group box family member 2-like isoform X2 [Salvelinus fontinalis]
MDVRFYPAPPSSVGSCTLPTDSSCLTSLDYYHCNKSRYGVSGDHSVRLYSSLPMRPNPDGKRLPSAGFDGDNMYMNENNQEFLSPNQSYSGQGGGGGASGNGAGDEDYEIPPITPPNHPEPPLLHLMDPESGYLCHSLGAHHNGLLNPYSYPELPALMMSNMLAQDGHLLSSQMPSITGEKRPSSEMMKPKPKPQKKKKKKDPNEPNKPVSAYALFFRDTQAAIKGSNPNATFGDVSKIVASMWDSLGEEAKQGYKRKTEAAKKEYLKALAAYRASLVSKTYNDPVETKGAQTSQPSSHMMPPNPPLYSVPPQPSSPYSLGPGGFPLSDLQSYAGAPRHALSRTLSQSQMLPSISASPPSSFQISPPLHQQLSLHQSSLLNQPIRMQHGQSQPIISHQMGLQASLHSPPPGQQGFSHLQSEYQKSVGSQSPAAPNPGGRQSHDWDSEYCDRECGGNHCSGSMIARDKPLYLT